MCPRTHRYTILMLLVLLPQNRRGQSKRTTQINTAPFSTITFEGIYILQIFAITTVDKGNSDGEHTVALCKHHQQAAQARHMSVRTVLQRPLAALQDTGRQLPVWRQLLQLDDEIVLRPKNKDTANKLQQV